MFNLVLKSYKSPIVNFIFLFFLIENCYGQITHDSLNLLLETAKKNKEINPETTLNQLTEIFEILKKQPDDIILYEVYRQKGLIYQKKNADSCTFFLYKALEVARKTKSRINEMQVMMNIATYDTELGNYDKAEKMFENIEKYILDYDKPQSVIALYLNWSNNKQTTDIESAIAIVNKAISYSNKKNYHELDFLIYEKLGGIYYNYGNYRNAIFNYKKSLVKADKKQQKIALLNSIASAYAVIDSIEEAKFYINKVLELKPFPSSLFYTYQTLSNIEKKIGNYEKAIILSDSILYYANILKNKNFICLAKISKMESLFFLKKYDDFVKMYDSNQDCINKGNIKNYSNILKMYIYSRSDKDDVKYIDEYIALIDSMKRIDQSRELIDFEIKLSNVEKEKEIQKLKLKTLQDKLNIEKLSVMQLNDELKLKELNLKNEKIEYEKKEAQSEIEEANLLKKHKESENVLLKKEQSLQKAKISSQNKILIGGGIGLGIISLLSLLLFRLSHKRKLMNETLLKQKDKIQLLNRELNHRVKNNLAFMTSLLEMQGRRTESEETRQALIESETRLKALALVHSQLFKSEADTEVNLKDYLEEIKQHLLGIFSIPDKKLNISSDFCDYTINAEDAMRLGLIVNESITNSVKHAFADVENPEIKISTSINKEGKLALYYSDNGPGILTTLKDNESSLGTKLIELLKKQLGERYVFMM